MQPEKKEDTSPVADQKGCKEAESTLSQNKKIQFESVVNNKGSEGVVAADRQALKEKLRSQLEDIEMEESLESLRDEEIQIGRKLEEVKRGSSEKTSQLEMTITDLQSQLKAARTSQEEDIRALEGSLKAVQLQIQDIEVKSCRSTEHL